MGLDLVVALVGMAPKRKPKEPAGDGKTKKAKPGQPSNIETAAKNAIDGKKKQRTIATMFGTRHIEIVLQSET